MRSMYSSVCVDMYTHKYMRVSTNCKSSHKMDYQSVYIIVIMKAVNVGQLLSAQG